MVVVIVSFLLGFVVVLCIGNFYRARKAMERQKQRRLARLLGGGNQNTSEGFQSPASQTSSMYSEERQSLLGSNNTRMNQRGNSTTNRRKADEGTDSLLLDLNENNNRPNVAMV